MTSQLPLTDAEIANIRASYPEWAQAYQGGKPTALFVYSLNPGDFSGSNINIDNTGVESRLGATTDPAANTGNGSLNALLKAVRDDVDSLNTFYGSLTNAGSSTGGALERLRAIAENTANSLLQPITYDIVGGATGNTGVLFSGIVYATPLNALLNTDPITPGAATGNATNIQLVGDTGDVAPFVISADTIPVLYSRAVVTADFTQPPDATTDVTISITNTVGDATALTTAGTQVFYDDGNSNVGLYQIQSGTASTIIARLVDPLSTKYTNAAGGTIMQSGGNIVIQTFIPEISDARWTHTKFFIRNSNQVRQNASNGIAADQYLMAYSLRASSRPLDFIPEANPWIEYGQDGQQTLAAVDVPGHAFFGLNTLATEQVYLYVEYLGGLFND